MKKINIFLLLVLSFVLVSYFAFPQEEGLEETLIEETAPGEEGLPEEISGAELEEVSPGVEESAPVVEEAPAEAPPVEVAPAPEAGPEVGAEELKAIEEAPVGEVPLEEVPVVEEAAPALEGAPEVGLEEMPSEEIPAGPPPAPAVAAPPSAPAPAVEVAPAPEAVVVSPPPAPTAPQPSALTEEEAMARPPKLTPDMFPEPTPGTFMKRPNIVLTEPLEYVVKEGDDLHFLAARFYGNARLWTKIYEANKKVLGKNPNTLAKGMRIIIPPVE